MSCFPGRVGGWPSENGQISISRLPAVPCSVHQKSVERTRCKQSKRNLKVSILIDVNGFRMFDEALSVRFADIRFGSMTDLA